MPLPVSKGPRTTTVQTLDGPVEVHGVTLEGARTISAAGEDGNAMCLALGTRSSLEDAKTYVSEAPAGDVKRVLQAIYDASGMTEGAQFPK